MTQGKITASAAMLNVLKTWGVDTIYGIPSGTLSSLMDALAEDKDCLLYTSDIEMLEMASHSYAVANAEEAVKAVANHLAPSHQEDGVYQVIEEYLGLTPWEQVKGKN